MGLSIVILAAGRGKRMHSSLPKVLHSMGGMSLLERVVERARELHPDDIFCVYGYGGEDVLQQLRHLNVKWIEQTDTLGTGHALMQAMPSIANTQQVLVLYGDVPLISNATLQALIKATPANGAGLVVAKLDDPKGYGRIIRHHRGHIMSIVEHRDATELQQQITEINTGILYGSADLLKHWLTQIDNHNAQKEFYLTDIVALAVNEGVHFESVLASYPEEVLGVNNRCELAHLERFYQHQMARQLLLSGVTLIDPARFDLRGRLNAAEDVTIDINVIIEGKVSIGKNSLIGPNTILRDVDIGNNVHIKAHSIIDGAKIADDCSIGPFARIRPGTKLATGAHIGNFVELKNANIDVASKINHLSYVGDADIGAHVNIGAGTITCNYDGVNKSRTTIDDQAFIGSNTALIAPVTIGKSATIAAGSTICDDVADNTLALARARQVIKPNWQRPSKDDKE